MFNSFNSFKCPLLLKLLSTILAMQMWCSVLMCLHLGRAYDVVYVNLEMLWPAQML